MPQIKHWKILNRSYSQSEDHLATWFVDPPYQGPCGKLYKYKVEDYAHLGNWCKERKGQVIVCEQHGADWLPFTRIGNIRTNPGKRGKGFSEEAIWTNHPELLK